jgi:hypothetical protein
MAISTVIILLLVSSSDWIMFIAFAMVIMQTAFHCTLTVTVSDVALRIRFGLQVNFGDRF